MIRPLTIQFRVLDFAQSSKAFSMKPTAEVEDPSYTTGMVAKELAPLLYEELRRLAAAHMARESAGQTIQATELVHEAWLCYSGDESWKDSGHFLTCAARTMRRILIDRARRKARIRHGGGLARVGIDDRQASAKTPDDQLLLVNEALDELEKIDPIRARVVILKFFGEMSNRQVATELGVTERSVERYWAHAKIWLFREIQLRR